MDLDLDVEKCRVQQYSVIKKCQILLIWIPTYYSQRY